MFWHVLDVYGPEPEDETHDPPGGAPLQTPKLAANVRPSPQTRQVPLPGAQEAHMYTLDAQHRPPAHIVEQLPLTGQSWPASAGTHAPAISEYPERHAAHSPEPARHWAQL